MARLIDADRALEIVSEQGIAYPNAYPLTKYATLILREAPTVDAMEVVHGRWKVSGGLLECQNCGEIYSTLGGNEGKAWYYCPYCGARMDSLAE